MDSKYSIKLSTFNGVWLRTFTRELELKASIAAGPRHTGTKIRYVRENVAALKAAKVPPIKIDVDINDVTFRWQYPIPYSLLEPYKVFLDKLLESGIIERSRYDWNSPVHLVKKPDGSLRFVLDLRQVNEKLRNQDYPMTWIDTAMAAVGGAKYFSTLDLASGYYQLKLDSNVTRCFAFQTHFGKFEMSRLPQGCKIASNVFQSIASYPKRSIGEESPMLY
ncbi:K02A2.6-like [Cordylochernes scorpioides]|uniref:K02A2.6-like n=1 Tax=Cordylochernes scorpioides TaxID=51811 RepID=A0ABY6LK88_9ARAC|nr:K02A2.6-like [Cordylochernes scorpioides]